MKGGELRRFREEQGWSQDEFGRVLKAALGKGSGTTIGKWENDQRPVPEDVAALVASLQLEAAFPNEPPLAEGDFGLESEAAPVEGQGDTAPPEPEAAGQAAGATGGQLPLSSSSHYSRVCRELWELIATGIGMVGAATGSEGLRRDGEIILGDAEALGRAWGKLAETNDTFRRMLLATTSGGAWLEVAMVSSMTGAKLYRSHQQIAAERAAEYARQEAEWEAEHSGQNGEVVDGFADRTAA